MIMLILHKILVTQIFIFITLFLLSYPGGFLGNLLEERYGDYCDGLNRVCSIQVMFMVSAGWLIFMNT